MADDESIFIGKQIGNYRIVAEGKSGSYGSIYQARHVIFTNKEVVAIKLLHAYLKSPKEREQFIQEAQLLNDLKYTYILPVLDAGIHEGLPYIIMEYASHGSLQDRLDAQPGKPMPIDEAIRIITQVGQALQHAHTLNIVHRDLKPDNILFNANDDALLADFGIAAILKTAHTKDLGRGGTPAYMAPEQFEGKVSIKSDQYALGCIAYELLTGIKPFDVENVGMEAVWFQHAKVEPVAPSQHNTHIPLPVEQAILKAMTKDRALRHNDIATFIAALHSTRADANAKVNTSSDNTPPPPPTNPYSGQPDYQRPSYEQPVAPYSGQPSDQQPTDPYSGQSINHSPSYHQSTGLYYGQPDYQQPSYKQADYQQPYYVSPLAGRTSSNSQYGPSSMNINPKIASGLSYVLGWVTGLIFFFAEKQNRFVRFHAMQSILFFGGLTVLNILLALISNVPYIGVLASSLAGLLGIVWLLAYIVLLVNGFRGMYFKLPIFGDYAEKYANQGIRNKM